MVSNKVSSVVPHWQVLLLGQFVSFLYFAGSALASTLPLAAPIFTTFCMNAVLSLFLIPVYFSRTLCNKRSDDDGDDGDYNGYKYLCCCIPLQGPWNAYAVCGLVDSAAMACMIGALQFSSLMSCSILFTLVIPATMAFSKCFLARQYSFRHCVGVLVCITGVILNILLDAWEIQENDTNTISMYPNKLFGNVLAICCACLLGLLDVLCEYSLEQYDGGTQEYLGATAFFAACFAILPGIILESEQIHFLLLDEHRGALINLAVLTLVNAGAYYFSTLFLEISEAALLNLSTLTETLMVVAFSVFFQNAVPEPLYLLGLAMVIAGTVIYESSPSPIVLVNNNDDGDLHVELPSTDTRPKQNPVYKRLEVHVHLDLEDTDSLETASLSESKEADSLC